MNILAWVLVALLAVGNAVAYYVSASALARAQDRQNAQLVALHNEHQERLAAAMQELADLRRRLEERRGDLAHYGPLLKDQQLELIQREKALDERMQALQEKARQMEKIKETWQDIRRLKLKAGE